MVDKRKFFIWLVCVAVGIGALKVLQLSRRPLPDTEKAAISVQIAPTGSVVIHVIDGDTLDCLVDGNMERIRLFGIDAPEGKQNYGPESTEHLRQLVSGKRFRIEITGKDRYGRSIAKLWDETGYLNQAMVRDGAAWWYRKYARTMRNCRKLKPQQDLKEEDCGWPPSRSHLGIFDLRMSEPFQPGVPMRSNPRRCHP